MVICGKMAIITIKVTPLELDLVIFKIQKQLKT
jgi:hypothetical protein